MQSCKSKKNVALLFHEFISFYQNISLKQHSSLKFHGRVTMRQRNNFAIIIAAVTRKSDNCLIFNGHCRKQMYCESQEDSMIWFREWQDKEKKTAPPPRLFFLFFFVFNMSILKYGNIYIKSSIPHSLSPPSCHVTCVGRNWSMITNTNHTHINPHTNTHTLT